MKRSLLFLVSLLLLAGGFWLFGARDVLHELQRFPMWGLLCITALFGLNLLVVSFRLFRVLVHFGMHLSWRIALKASISGYVAGLFVISLFGQVIGRHLVLKKIGVGPVLIASLSAYERFSLLLISGLLCVWGSVSLFHSTFVAEFLAGTSLAEIMFASTVAFVLSVFVARSRFEINLLKKLCSFNNVTRFLEIGAITLVAQILVLAAFVVGVLALYPETDLLMLFAAAAIISFAASLPISVNGWGVREIAAVYSLAPLGVSSSSAMAVSISVGLCSTLVVFLAVPFTLKKAQLLQVDQDTSYKQAISAGEKVEVEKTATWMITTAAAILIFFQIHVPLEGGVISLNLADPFAILSLAAVTIYLIGIKAFPTWKIKYFNFILILISGLLLFAFLRGVYVIGVTQWAFASRLMGWLVILGYMSIGFLLVVYFGKQGCRRFVETMLITAAVIVFVQIFIRWAIPFGWFEDTVITANFEGYSGNRNTFAFQMLIASVLLMTYTVIYARAKKQVILVSILHGFVLAGLFLSASRAGIIVGAVLVVLSFATKWADRKVLVLSLVFAGAIWGAPQLDLPEFDFPIFASSSSGITKGGGSYEKRLAIQKTRVIQSEFSYQGSNEERMKSIHHGIDMWKSNPIIGAGLGVFFAKSSEWFGHSLVIHSTPIWILAEFGLFGVLIFCGILIAISYRLFLTHRLIASRIVLLLLGVFLIFGMVHDIFFQRTFWLVLGIFMASKFRLPNLKQKM